MSEDAGQTRVGRRSDAGRRRSDAGRRRSDTGRTQVRRG